jgi:hypothetical protein
METRTQDANGDITSAISRKPLIIIVVVFLALGLGLGAGYFLGSGIGSEPSVALGSNFTPRSTSPETVTSEEATAPQPAQNNVGVPATYLTQPVSDKEMFSEFICPCCGKPIGECSCGMAGERRGFVSGLMAAEQNRLGIYLAYADQYGLDTFASQEVIEDIRKYKQARAPEERPQIVLESQQAAICRCRYAISRAWSLTMMVMAALLRGGQSRGMTT